MQLTARKPACASRMDVPAHSFFVANAKGTRDRTGMGNGLSRACFSHDLYAKNCQTPRLYQLSRAQVATEDVQEISQRPETTGFICSYAEPHIR